MSNKTIDKYAAIILGNKNAGPATVTNAEPTESKPLDDATKEKVDKTLDDFRKEVGEKLQGAMDACDESAKITAKDLAIIVKKADSE